MLITDLPVEILVVIIKKLDIKSVHNLFQTCSHFKNIICMSSVVKTADLSLSTAASVHFLKQTFMKNISRNLHTLDVHGIGDLSRTTLLAAIRGMKCLNTLDVSYTNINLFDFYEVYKLCPTIKNVACNFVFGAKKDIKARTIDWQGLFQNFDKVHFVGTAANLLHSSLSDWMLHKARLSQFVLTIVENCAIVYDTPIASDTNAKVQSKYISICILNGRRISALSRTMFAPSHLLNLEEKYECVVVIIEDDSRSQVYVSSMLEKFCESLNLKSIKLFNLIQDVVIGAIMLWDRSQNVFDDKFFQVFKTKIMIFLRYHITDNTTVVPQEYDKFFLTVPSRDTKVNATDTITFKKQRLAPQPLMLDYDTVFSNHNRVHLQIFFPSKVSCPVTLSPNSQYLRKLQSLFITGPVHYSSDFFNILFTCCEQLQTLNVEDSPYSPNQMGVGRHVPQSRSLKNLTIIDRAINFKTLFSSLSQCSTLENIHIVDLSQNYSYLADPSALFDRCHNLYCISICATISNATKAKTNQIFKQLKTKYGKRHVLVELAESPVHINSNYNPYRNVFNITGVKPFEQLY